MTRLRRMPTLLQPDDADGRHPAGAVARSLPATTSRPVPPPPGRWRARHLGGALGTGSSLRGACYRARDISRSLGRTPAHVSVLGVGRRAGPRCHRAPRRVIEIGALRGENTVLMLDRLGPGVELHVVDPVPDFDPAEHEQKFPGRYVFHRDLSLNVLRRPAPDGRRADRRRPQLVHGLQRVPRSSPRSPATTAAPMPVMILHDVLWPYGRRDLYYNPPDVPDEFRQPWDRRGMSPHKKKLLQGGGLNQQLANAVEEGGPRNGVMTGLEDFIAEYDKPLRLVVLPIYFGLAIVAEEEYLAANPKLDGAPRLPRERRGPPPAARAVRGHPHRGCGVPAEHVRELRAQDRRRRQALPRPPQGRAARRALHRERAAHRAPAHRASARAPSRRCCRCATRAGSCARPPSTSPPRSRPARSWRRTTARSSSPGWSASARSRTITRYFPYTSMGRRAHRAPPGPARRRPGRSACPGDLVECGTGRGGGAIFMRGYLEAHEIAGRKVWVADRFRASPDADGAGLQTPEDEDGDDRDARAARRPQHRPRGLRALRPARRPGAARPGRLRVHAPRGRHRQDRPPADRRRAPGRDGRGARRSSTPRSWSVASSSSTTTSSRAAPPPSTSSCAASAPTSWSRRVDWAGVWWRKEAEAAPVVAEPEVEDRGPRGRRRPTHGPAPRSSPRAGSSVASVAPSSAPPALAPGARRPRSRAAPTALLGSPLAPEVKGPKKDLSVVVVFYNMKREAARTLHSLSRAYQQQTDGPRLRGPRRRERLAPRTRSSAPTFVESFGPEFRYIDLGDARPPVAVLRAQRGRRPLDRPGRVPHDRRRPRPHARACCAAACTGSDLYAPAVVVDPAVVRRPRPAARHHARRLRPGGRGPAVPAGRVAGERLPAVRDRPLHRRPRLARRRVGEQLPVRPPRACSSRSAALDESFTHGRAAASPTSSSTSGSPAPPRSHEATILGEGSFHQVHGGTTTNDADVVERRDKIRSYADHYAEMRGRGFRGPNKTMHFVGSMSPNSVRSRSRRHLAPAFFTPGHGRRPGRAADRTPMPDPRGPRGLLHRGLLAEPGLAAHVLARSPGGAPAGRPASRTTSSSTRSGPNWIINTAHRRRRPGDVPGLDVRPGRPRPGALHRQPSSATTCPSTTGSPTSTRRSRDRRPRPASRRSPARGRRTCWPCSAPPAPSAR